MGVISKAASTTPLERTTLAIQDFEVTPQLPVWNFTGPVTYENGYSSASNAAPTNSPIGINGSRAWGTTSNSGGLTLEFSNVDIPAGYDSVRVNFKLAAMNLINTGGGPDNLDYVLVEISTNGGANYYSRMRIRGATTDNSYWPYSASGVAKVYYQPQTEALFQPTTSDLQDARGYSTCEIVFPGSVSQVRVRITARSSSSTDTWLIDNLAIIGEKTVTSEVGASEFKASGSLGVNGCQVQLLARGVGESFVMTGPGGYVFSSVFRTAGSYSVSGLDVKEPGTYTLTVCSGSASATYTTVVEGSACSVGQ